MVVMRPTNYSSEGCAAAQSSCDAILREGQAADVNRKLTSAN